ncbi:aspartyl-phosphate phosphatase Spo0E family protein [Clostridium sp. 001]|uniref:aspartyl-phosphate phosphatase Spo0E family protein n=1 Tax=Clostridium sp. 001 TaxID=1970093 RepID=UPI001C2C87E5|nr:aspartyl-phosphate phosphatase Spo0E family protein [Clostridium sp. 001]
MNSISEKEKNELRKKLNNCAYRYGTLDQRTLEISQEVDKFMVEDMKKEIKRILCQGFN